MFFLLREGASGVRRGVFHSFVSVMSIAVAVSLLGFFYYGGWNLNRAAQQLLGRFEFEAFISLACPEAKHEELQQNIQSRDTRWMITYISRQAAAAQFSREFDPNLFEILKENPLPASFRISVPLEMLSLDSAQVIAQRLRSLPEIDDVVYDLELLQWLQLGVRKLKSWGFIAGSIALLLTIALVYNAMRLKIDAQRETITLMSLLGASPQMLRTIFWIQGVLLGFSGGVSASLIIYGVAAFLTFRLGATWTVELPYFYGTVLSGCLLGLLGSMAAVGRYLKV
ncbi:MAG: permease-like cell division protein FtsX [bacterium]